MGNMGQAIRYRLSIVARLPIVGDRWNQGKAILHDHVHYHFQTQLRCMLCGLPLPLYLYNPSGILLPAHLLILLVQPTLQLILCSMIQVLYLLQLYLILGFLANFHTPLSICLDVMYCGILGCCKCVYSTHLHVDNPENCVSVSYVFTLYMCHEREINECIQLHVLLAKIYLTYAR